MFTVSPVFNFLFKKWQSPLLKRVNRSIRTSESLLPSKKGKEQFALFKKSEKRTSKPDVFIAYSCAETIEAQNCDEVDTNLSNLLTDYDNRFLTK